jgi:hypothetical protein
MKNLLLILVFTLFTSIAFSEDTVWLSYELDSNFLVDFPGEVFEIDTTIKGVHIYQLMSGTDSVIYIAQKSLFGELNIDENLSRLPYDDTSLEEFYESTIQGIKKTVPAIFSEKRPLTIDSFKGYQVEFVDSLDNLIFADRFVLLDKYLYKLTIIDYNGLNTELLNRFFDSIEILDGESISQFSGQPQTYRIGYVIGQNIFLIAIIIGVIVWMVRRIRKKTTYNNV